MKHRTLKTLATGALLLAASSAMAGILFVPIGDKYIAPDLVPLSIQGLGDSRFVIRSDGLTGEWTLRGSDFPPEADIDTAAQRVLPFAQDLELTVTLTGSTVSGNSVVRVFDPASPELAVVASVQGSATCLPRNGRECGQLVLDLELRGAVTHASDPACVGELHMEMLGSLVWDDADVIRWAALDANTTLGGNDALIASLHSMEEGESCGI